jgi:hypothetical protein
VWPGVTVPQDGGSPAPWGQTDSVDGKLLQGDCQIPASGLDLTIQAEQNSIY